MTNEQVKQMATQIIGDGQTPNKFFVVSSPYYLVVDEYGDIESELLDGFDEASYSEYKVFDTYKEACDYYEDQDLDTYSGVGTVTIEDRLTGKIKMKVLEKVVKVDYTMTEYDDGKMFGYEK